MKSDVLYKLGSGPIDRSWNKRYFILDQAKWELTYYISSDDLKKRGTINLKNALVSNITMYQERPFSFSLQTSPPDGETYYLSCDSE